MIRRFSGAWLAAFLFTFSAVSGGAETAEERLRRENQELRTKLLAQEKELRQLRLWLADVACDGKVLDSPEREARTLAVLQQVVRQGMKLAGRADGISREVRRLAAESTLSDSRKAQLALRLDELDSEVRGFVALGANAGQEKFECRLMAVEQDLGIVILSGGMEQGFFPGMIFHPVGKGKTLRLRLIGVRPGASAAELLEGKWEELVPGMRLTAFSSGNGEIHSATPQVRRSAPR